MTSRCQPIIGDWYQKPSGELFEVVAVDSKDGSIDIQYFSGEIEELDDESWFALEISTADAPEDISGAYDQLDEGEGAHQGGSDHVNLDDVLDQIDREL